jgi:hypothetical protein
MGKGSRSRRAPTNQLLAAAKLTDASQVRSKVAVWVSGILNDNAGLAQEQIPDSDALHLWGYGSEEALVSIAFKYNTTLKRKGSIRPPDLILNVAGRTVGDLIDFIASRVSAQPLSSAKTSELDGEVFIDLTAVGGNLFERIQRFTLNFLSSGYTAVTPKTPLGVFRDGRTLDILAGAFADEVKYGTLFSGLIDSARLRLPQIEYFPVIGAKGATVSDVIQFFLKHAKEAAPR